MKRQGNTVPTTSKILPRITGSDVTEFNWKTHCFCCGSPCVPNPKHLERKKLETLALCFSRKLVIKTYILKTFDQTIDKGA